MRRLLAAATAAAVLAAAPAAAYVRTTDRGTGKALFWPVPAVPWRLNRDWPNASPSCRAAEAGDPAFAAVRASFAAWQQSCSNLRLVEGGTTAELRTGSTDAPGDNVVVFRRGWCSQNPGASDCFDDACDPGATECAEWNLVALTSVLYEPQTGRIVDADIEIVGWDGADAGGDLPPSQPRRGWYFTCGDEVARCARYGDAACRSMDLQNTVTHEAGHFIGLAHAPSAEATMFARTSAGEVEKRSLSADDVAGVCAIYPPPDDGGCGCGSAGAGGGAVALLVAALALRRRPLRRSTSTTPR